MNSTDNKYVNEKEINVMKKRVILLLMVMCLGLTGCGGSKDVCDNQVENVTEQEMEEIEQEETEQVEVEGVTEEVVEETEANVQVEMEVSQDEKIVEDVQEESKSELIPEVENQVTVEENVQPPSYNEPVVESPTVEEATLQNADHPFFEVFLVEHCYKDDGEYYYWGFYMPYGCDTDNCPEYDQAYYELICKMKGEKAYVFYGLDGEFADLGEYSFVRIGYRVPTEYMPETLTIHYAENVHWGYPGYIVYYTEDEHGSDKWWATYQEFVDTYVSYDAEGRMNLYHDTRYFVDGEVECYYVYER